MMSNTTVKEIPTNIAISVGLAHSIIHDGLHFTKMSYEVGAMSVDCRIERLMLMSVMNSFDAFIICRLLKTMDS